MGKSDDDDRDSGDSWSDNPLSDPYDTQRGEDTDNFRDEGEPEESSFEETTTESYEKYDDKLDAKSPIVEYLKKTKPDLTKEQIADEMKKLSKIPATMKCGFLMLGGLVQGGMAGFAFGGVHHGFFGLVQGRHKFPGFGREILGAAKQSSGMFALWLGCFFGANCGIKAIRHQEGKGDVLTNFSSGFFAGFVSTMKTRNLQIMAMNGLMSGVLVTIMDGLGQGN